jgi:7-cyano-7-deazaguanine synthase
MKIVILLSGGMDSVTSLYDAHGRHQILAALSFSYGSKHNARELPFAELHARRLGIEHLTVPLDFVGEHFQSHLLRGGGSIPKGHYEEEMMKQTVVPFRNGIMLAIAAGFGESRGAEGLLIAAHAGDHAIYPDCREGFMQSMARAIRLGTYEGVELLRPFITMSKAEVTTLGCRLGIDYAETWSCYEGGEVHCGECGTCVERREAFELAGIPDPTRYVKTTPLPPKPALK